MFDFESSAEKRREETRRYAKRRGEKRERERGTCIWAPFMFQGRPAGYGHRKH